jgi:hypothetical protein
MKSNNKKVINGFILLNTVELKKITFVFNEEIFYSVYCEFLPKINNGITSRQRNKPYKNNKQMNMRKVIRSLADLIKMMTLGVSQKEVFTVN